MKEPGSGRGAFSTGAQGLANNLCPCGLSWHLHPASSRPAPRGQGLQGTSGIRNGTTLQGQVQRPAPWERTPGRWFLAVSLLPAQLSASRPLCVPGLRC